ncbi:MAG: ABC transporter substrate-binding protein [Clostridia bacterium]|nr:ABC transporter substrate-binding protein [Clostridia bacterium]
MKKLLSLVLVLALTFSLSAGVMAEEIKDAKETAEYVTAVEYPLTVKDQADREVTLEKEPESLVSCYYISSSLLMALGLGDRIVGIENNPETRPIYALSDEKLLELQPIGTAKEIDLEACAKLAPELAVIPMKVKDSAEDLENLGINVIIVNPESKELLAEMISTVAEATNTVERGNQLIAYIDEKEAELTKKLEKADTPKVYLASNSAFLATAGNKMYQSDLIKLAGGVNVAEEIEDTYWAEVDYEQILTWDPEYIILPSSAKYTVDEVLADEVLADCTAVKNGNVYQIPGDIESWDSPVPSSFLGAYYVAGVLHPELVSEKDFDEAVKDYYETFYNFEEEKKN